MYQPKEGNCMTILETVALDYDRWWATAMAAKFGNHARFTWMVELTLAAAVLEVLALQLHTSYPIAAQIAGYAGVAALALVVVIRMRGLSRERIQAWVLAAAAAHALKSEMYLYRTSCGPFAESLGIDPDETLLQRRNEIVEKLGSIQKYIAEPKEKITRSLDPLDADAYISERINSEIRMFRQFTSNLNRIQCGWLRNENFLLIGGTLLAAILTFTHNQVYLAWAAVIAIMSIASGVTAKSERYATLLVEVKTMPVRLTSILDRWQANHGTLDQLVQQVEDVLLAQAQTWLLGINEIKYIAPSSPASDPTLKSALPFPASRVGA
jgi:hypothetical protein